MKPTPDNVRETVLNFVAEDVACDYLEGDPSRIGCVTPLQYPDDDSVVGFIAIQGLLEAIARLSV